MQGDISNDLRLYYSLGDFLLSRENKKLVYQEVLFTGNNFT